MIVSLDVVINWFSVENIGSHVPNFKSALKCYLRINMNCIQTSTCNEDFFFFITPMLRRVG